MNRSISDAAWGYKKVIQRKPRPSHINHVSQHKTQEYKARAFFGQVSARGELIEKIEYMVGGSGKKVYKINPKYTSGQCSCHYIDSSNRDGEKFVCLECGHIDDALLASIA